MISFLGATGDAGRDAIDHVHPFRPVRKHARRRPSGQLPLRR